MKYTASARLPSRFPFPRRFRFSRRLLPAVFSLLLAFAASGHLETGHTPSATFLAGDDTKIGTGGG